MEPNSTGRRRRLLPSEEIQRSCQTAGKDVPAGTMAMVSSTDFVRASERPTAIATLNRQRHLTPSCGGFAPTAERTVGLARMSVGGLDTQRGIREQYRHEAAGYRIARPIALGACQCSQAFRLSPTVRPAAPTWRAVRTKPYLPALPGGRPQRPPAPAPPPRGGCPGANPGRGSANARWSLDFVHDQFANGRRFRILNIGVDDVTPGNLLLAGVIPDTSFRTTGGARTDGADRLAAAGASLA